MKLKRKLACLMAVIVFVSAFGCYSDMKPEASVRAETTEEAVPVYDTTCHRYTVTGATSGYEGSYADGVLTAPAGSNAWITSELSNEDSYYMSMTVKTSQSVNIAYRRGTKNNTYFQIKGSGYLLFENGATVVPEESDSICNKLKTGLTVTFYSTPTHIKIWIEDKKVIDYQTSNMTMVNPGIQWATGDTATFSDIYIWSEGDGTVPVYDEQNSVLHEVTGVTTGYTNKNVSYTDGILFVENNANGYLTSDLESDASYYMSMTLKSDKASISVRENAAYYFLFDALTNSGKGQYHAIDIASASWQNPSTPIFKIMRNEGIDITYYSSPTHLTVWANGYKLIDGDYTAVRGAATPGVSWATYDTTVSNIKIWTEKPEAKPKYDSTCHRYTVTGATSGYEGISYANEVLTVPSGANAWFTTDLVDGVSYYMSMKVKTQGSVNIAYRDTTEYIQINSSGYQLILDGTSQGWETLSNSDIKTTGLEITYYSTPTGIKIWFGDTRVVNYTYETASADALKLGVQWSNSNEVVISDVCIWTVGDGTVPVYDEQKHVLHEVTGVTTGYTGKNVTYTDGILFVENNANGYLTTDLKSDASYYMSMTLKSDKASVSVRENAKYYFLFDSLTNSGKGQYHAIDIASASWQNPSSAIFKIMQNEGISITYYSSPTHLTVWANGYKLIDGDYTATRGNATPGISWAAYDTTVSDIKIWTEPDAMLKGTNATLDGNIGMNFFMRISDDTVANGEDVCMKFTVPGTAQQKVALSEATYNETQDAYVFTCNMAAKRMSEEITAQLFVGEEAVSEAYSYTIEEYAREIIGGDYTEAEKALAQNMLHYGAYSQLYLNHNPSVLPNVGLEALDMSSVTKDDIDVSKNVLTIAGLGSIVASNLSLKSETTLKMYFAPIEGVENLTFTYGNETLTTSDYTYTDGSQWICIAITNIAANELDDTLEIGVTDGTNTGTLKYSALTYGYNVLNMTSPKETLSNLVKALYYYNASANALLEASQE